MDLILTLVELAIAIATVVVIFQTHSLAERMMSRLYEVETNQKELKKLLEEQRTAADETHKY